jgi:hypothetical protein
MRMEKKHRFLRENEINPYSLSLAESVYHAAYGATVPLAATNSG